MSNFYVICSFREKKKIMNWVWCEKNLRYLKAFIGPTDIRSPLSLLPFNCWTAETIIVFKFCILLLVIFMLFEIKIDENSVFLCTYDLFQFTLPTMSWRCLPVFVLCVLFIYTVVVRLCFFGVPLLQTSFLKKGIKMNLVINISEIILCS